MTTKTPHFLNVVTLIRLMTQVSLNSKHKVTLQGISNGGEYRGTPPFFADLILGPGDPRLTSKL